MQTTTNKFKIIADVWRISNIVPETGSNSIILHEQPVRDNRNMRRNMRHARISLATPGMQHYEVQRVPQNPSALDSMTNRAIHSKAVLITGKCDVQSYLCA
jgi:hypothetical protein